CSVVGAARQKPHRQRLWPAEEWKKKQVKGRARRPRKGKASEKPLVEPGQKRQAVSFVVEDK
ncbi:hypothetical protein ACEE86_21570, partial [Proteus mirabilis]